MSQATKTPIPFWLDMKPAELIVWIQDINSAAKEDQERMKREQQRKG